MNGQSLDSYDDVVEEVTDETETTGQGSGLVKRRFKNTVDGSAGPAKRLDTDFVTEPQAELVEDATSTNLPRCVASSTVKRRNKEKLAVAQSDFGPFSVLKTTPEQQPARQAANDNFKQQEAWPLRDLITRPAFEPDEHRRAKLIWSIRHIRDLIDTAGTDSLGLSIHLPGRNMPSDYDVQRMDTGKVYYENGQTLDRKKRTYDHKNGETDAERHDGGPRKAGKVSNSGFDVFRDDPFPARIIAAHEELDEIIAAVGPLWLPLADAISGNATATQIGLAFGYRHTQAPAVGTAIMKLALAAAMEAIDRHNEKPDESYLERLQRLPNGTPVPARRLKRALERAQLAA